MTCKSIFYLFPDTKHILFQFPGRKRKGFTKTYQMIIKYLLLFHLEAYCTKYADIYAQ